MKMARPVRTAHTRWVQRVREDLPDVVFSYPALRPLRERATMLLHGSASRGVHDRWSDLDVWLWVSPRELRAIDAASPTRFFEFFLGGRPGHANAESRDHVLAMIRGCDFGLIHELRRAIVVRDPDGFGRKMIALARRPMRAALRRRLFFYHYVEMRGYHRNLDNPLNRGDRASVLLALGVTLGHALRAAMVLDGAPPPYDKWLPQAAAETPTGRLVVQAFARIMLLVGRGALNRAQDEVRHPVNLELRKIRAGLVDAAHRHGIREPWLGKWYLHIDQARAAGVRARW